MLILSGCKGSLSKDADEDSMVETPPKVTVEVDSETYETILGSYCWEISSKGEEKTAKCVDAAGPEELLKSKDPIQVSAGKPIKLIVDYTPKPNKVDLVEIKNGVETEIELEDNQFIAPAEKGVYVYSYGLWWMDEEVENTSNNDAFYAFSIKVK